MSIHAALNHVTHYRYDRPVELGPQVVRLRPAPHTRTRVPSYSLTVTPAQHFVNWQQDPHGNWLARFVFPEKAEELRIEVDLTADIAVINPFDFFVEPYAETLPFAYPEELRAELAPYLETEPAGPRLQAFLDAVPREAASTVQFLVDLNARIQRDIKYGIRMEPGVQTPDETLEATSGSCRDSAWLLVQVVRHLGLAARFVSGYLIQLRPDIAALEGPSGAEHDFTDLHAWAEVYIPGAGWIGLDATSGLLCGEGHIPLAATLHYRSAAPISGVVEPANVEFGFDMRVTRINEAPRVTKPFSDEAWERLDRLGDRVDVDIRAQDMRLTMGGEPTFVSIDDFEGAEWNTSAVGPTKRAVADDLIRRLRARFAPGGLLHYGQGKWYPGESLPRWAFSLYWRHDGQPIWRNADLIATEAKQRPIPPDEAERFMGGVAERIGLDPSYVLPAYEDPAHWMLKEGELPINVDPGDPKLADPEARARMVRVFERGLDKPAGFVLPIQRWNAADRRAWRSERWPLRRGKLYLAPGDSPVGLRLPISSLPWVPPESYPHVVPQDPTEPRAPLPVHQAAPAAPAAARQDIEEQHAGGDAVRTAMSIEPRDGVLCVFMPPLERVEDYLELIAAVEATARASGLAVHVEGYPPPVDPRLNVIKVTPDPGVIEVNVHPAASWREAVEITT